MIWFSFWWESSIQFSNQLSPNVMLVDFHCNIQGPHWEPFTTSTYTHVNVVIVDVNSHFTCHVKPCKCKSWCKILLKILHYPLPLEIMICKKIKALHFTLFLYWYLWIFKQQNLTTTKTQRQYMKQIINEICNKVNNYKITMISSLKYAKIIN